MTAAHTSERTKTESNLYNVLAARAVNRMECPEGREFP